MISFAGLGSGMRITKYILPIILVCAAGCKTLRESNLRPGELLCEELSEPLGIGTGTPRLSWKNVAQRNNAAQSAYHLIASSERSLLDKDTGDLWDSGKVESNESVMIPWGGVPLPSRRIVHWKVRTWDQRGAPSGWSKPAEFSVGLIGREDWEAKYIGLALKDGDPGFPQLRKNFLGAGPCRRALLHVNSLGYHEAYINQHKVDDSVLTPAVSQMDKRSLAVTYDVTALLRPGTNTLAVWLGQGWFSYGLPGVDYKGPLVRAQLEVLTSGEWKTVVATGTGWKARPSEISAIGNWRGGNYGGEKVDAGKALDAFASPELDDSGWSEAAVVDTLDRPAVPQKAERNRIRQTLHPVGIRGFEGTNTWLVDFGKNLTGWVEVVFKGLNAGQEITMEFSDFLEENGKLKDQAQRDIYIAGPRQEQTFRNRFNYHGFRYMVIRNLREKPEPDSIRAFLVHTDYRIASSFESSDQDLNRIHDMISYTLRCLSLGGYLVDCPQVERLGYGGDGNASTLTAQTMFDLGPLYANWLDNWSDCIRPDGGMPHTAPNPYPAGGGPYWCGFIITAAWMTYASYGDVEMLRNHYPAMKQWLAHVGKYSRNGLLAPWPDTDYGTWYLGDWASPQGVNDKHQDSIDLIGNSYVVICLDRMVKIAALLGFQADAAEFRTWKEHLKAKINERFYNQSAGIYADGDQIDLAFPLIAGVVPDDLREPVTENLQKNIVEKNNGHMATGLVGVPVLTEWATTSKSVDLMYSMLKAEGYPGYLHMIRNGATTTWEHWNGERSHIHNCFNGVGSWFYQALGGIRPLDNFPAYRKFRIDPQVPKALSWVKAKKDTPYGQIEVRWEKAGKRLIIRAVVPVGTTAELFVPDRRAATLDGRSARSGLLVLSSGSHQIEWEL